MYTKFVSMFMLQELTDRRKSFDLKKRSVDFNSIREQSYTLKFQSDEVVEHMLRVM